MSCRILQGDATEQLLTLPDKSVQCVVTSPPYWGLRDYGTPGQLGLEATPDEYVSKMTEVFREVRRVLRSDGTCWLNMGDKYSGGGGYSPDAPSNQGTPVVRGNRNASQRFTSERRAAVVGLKPKDLVGMPWRVAFALQADGWYLRADIIWAKGISFCPSYSGSVMPESVTDRPTKGHEYLFLLTKNARYYYDAEAVRETARYPDGANAPDKVKSPYGQGFTANRSTGASQGGRNLCSVWAINPEPFSEAHFATFPQKLVEPCIKAGTSGKGCCAACGAPLVRVVEISYKPSSGVWRGRIGDAARNPATRTDLPTERKQRISDTTGWSPSCACDAETKPCIVLDPFCGSGTSGIVALRLGLDFIGIDLSP